MSENETTYGLTPEDWAILEATVPQSEIKSYEGRGGKEMRYTSVEFVESRLAKVDPNFSSTIVLGERGVTVHYTVKGVTHGGAFDYDEDGKFGTAVTNAEARAARRAAKKFHVARELWEDVVEDKPANATKFRTESSGSSSRASYGKGKKEEEKPHKEPTVNQLRFLVEDLLVPEKAARALNAYGTKKGDGTWQSEVSDVIEALKAAKFKDKSNYSRNAKRLVEVALRELSPEKGYPAFLSDDEDDD